MGLIAIPNFEGFTSFCFNKLNIISSSGMLCIMLDDNGNMKIIFW